MLCCRALSLCLRYRDILLCCIVCFSKDPPTLATHNSFKHGQSSPPSINTTQQTHALPPASKPPSRHTTPRRAVARACHHSRTKAGGTGRRYPGRSRQQVERDAVGPSEAHLTRDKDGAGHYRVSQPVRYSGIAA